MQAPREKHSKSPSTEVPLIVCLQLVISTVHFFDMFSEKPSKECFRLRIQVLADCWLPSKEPGAYSYSFNNVKIHRCRFFLPCLICNTTFTFYWIVYLFQLKYESSNKNTQIIKETKSRTRRDSMLHGFRSPIFFTTSHTY